MWTPLCTYTINIKSVSPLIRRLELFKDNEKVLEFSSDMIEYIKNTWINGIFCVQDWNLFEINCQTVPCTNNGNEGENSKLAVLFDTHPQFYKFTLLTIKELDKSQKKVIDILEGVNPLMKSMNKKFKI